MHKQYWFGIMFRPAAQQAAGNPALPAWAEKPLDDGATSEEMNESLAVRGYQGLPLTWLVWTETPCDYYALAVTGSVDRTNYPEDVEDQWADSIGQAALILALPAAEITWHRTYSRTA